MLSIQVLNLNLYSEYVICIFRQILPKWTEINFSSICISWIQKVQLFLPCRNLRVPACCIQVKGEDHFRKKSCRLELSTNTVEEIEIFKDASTQCSVLGWMNLLDLVSLIFTPPPHIHILIWFPSYSPPTHTHIHILHSSLHSKTKHIFECCKFFIKISWNKFFLSSSLIFPFPFVINQHQCLWISFHSPSLGFFCRSKGKDSINQCLYSEKCVMGRGSQREKQPTGKLDGKVKWDRRDRIRDTCGIQVWRTLIVRLQGYIDTK